MIAARTRFLVLRGGAIGDFIVTLPALRAIRNQWPEAYIECIGYPHIARLGLEGGLVNHVDSLDRARIVAFFSHPPAFSADQVEFIQSFDVIFSWLHDPNGLVRENLELAGAKQVIYGSPLIPAGRHAVDHLVEPLESLAMYAQSESPRLILSDDTRKAGQEWIAQRGLSDQRCVFIHPGSGSPRKNWPIDRFLALENDLRESFRAIGLYVLGEADEEVRPMVEQMVPENRVVRDLSLSQLAGVLAQGHGYVGNDSGITHLAAAVGLPVVALFGPSNPASWGPRGDAVRILQHPSGCLESISVVSVQDCLRDLLQV